ncbi:MAG: C_GCAxxG_C_C family protein [Desulfobacterales bacterium]|nr:MAG: C_GCAxxG_C_C family protein [Desulfobacterales bacterium]UCD90247.1 MAG: C_GCAxxG_C_C family protein [Desulfobacterales bacterium]
MPVKEIKKQVYQNFESGYHCAEVVAKTIIDNFSTASCHEAVKASSCFGGVIAGTTEDLCGAFTGGVIALGVLVGRENPGEAMTEGAELVKEYKAWFLEQFGSTNCQTLLEGFYDKEGMIECVKLTADATAFLAKLLNAFEKKKEIDMDAFCNQPRESVALGTCPFSGCSC